MNPPIQVFLTLWCAVPIYLFLNIMASLTQVTLFSILFALVVGGRTAVYDVEDSGQNEGVPVCFRIARTVTNCHQDSSMNVTEYVIACASAGKPGTVSYVHRSLYAGDSPEVCSQNLVPSSFFYAEMSLNATQQSPHQFWADGDAGCNGSCSGGNMCNSCSDCLPFTALGYSFGPTPLVGQSMPQLSALCEVHTQQNTLFYVDTNATLGVIQFNISSQPLFNSGAYLRTSFTGDNVTAYGIFQRNVKRSDQELAAITLCPTFSCQATAQLYPLKNIYHGLAFGFASLLTGTARLIPSPILATQVQTLPPQIRLCWLLPSQTDNSIAENCGEWQPLQLPSVRLDPSSGGEYVPSMFLPLSNNRGAVCVTLLDASFNRFDQEHHVYCMDASSGEIIWWFPIPSEAELDPTSTSIIVGMDQILYQCQSATNANIACDMCHY